MDWMQFVAALIDSLAWPIGAVVLGFAVRGSVVELLQRFTTLEAAGVKMPVAARAVEAVRSLDAVPPPIPEPGGDGADGAASRVDTPEDGRHERPSPETGAAGDDPRPDVAGAGAAAVSRGVDGVDVVRSAWGRLQYALRRLLREANVQRGPLTDTRVFALLRAESLTSSETAGALEALRKVKNDVVSGRASTSYADAVAFERSANLIVREIVGSLDNPDVAAAMTGQDDVATMNYAQLRDRLKSEFPIKRDR